MTAQPPDPPADPVDPHPAAEATALPGASPSGHPSTTPEPDDEDAMMAALARARAVARSHGLRPGSPAGRRRRKDVPADARRSPEGRDPAMLGDQLDRLVADRGWDVDVSVGSVMGRWSEIMGPEIASHCTPVTFEAGVLTVRAESTAWATQLRLLSSSLLGRLEGEVGTGTVTELRVVGPSAPTWSRGPRRSDGPGPRDTYG